LQKNLLVGQWQEAQHQIGHTNMYFSLLPDIQYDNKPVKYPFSESDFVIAKNFFRRFILAEELFDYAVFFQKYTITDEDRLDLLADKFYKSPFYDWVIILTNNMINGVFDWPLKEEELYKIIAREFNGNEIAIHHYETKEIKNSSGQIVLKEGLHVGADFTFSYTNSSQLNIIIKLSGASVITPISNLDYVKKKNEEKREIFILKKNYIESFVNEFSKSNLYSKSSDYIETNLKKTGI